VPNVFETLAPPTRQVILRFVWTEERSAGHIATELAKKAHITFGAVSQHLSVLRQAGLIDQRKNGRERWYKANRAPLGPIAQYLESMWFGSLMKLKTAAEKEEQECRKTRSRSKSR
jgi:DNA-binding transcriptional ArsR family regulator